MRLLKINPIDISAAFRIACKYTQQWIKIKKIGFDFNVCAVWYCSIYYAISSNASARAYTCTHPPMQYLLPCFYLLCPAGSSHSYCQHSYQSIPSFNLFSPLWPFPLSPDDPNFVAQPWHSNSSLPVSSGKGATSWLHSQEISCSSFCCLPVVLSAEFCRFLRVPCKLYMGLFPEPKSQCQEAPHGAHGSFEDPGERHLHSLDLH